MGFGHVSAHATIVQAREAKIIENAEGSRLTPSVVTLFADDMQVDWWTSVCERGRGDMGCWKSHPGPLFHPA